MSKLHDFATAVGTDIKEIKTALAGKAEKGEVTANGITQEQLNTAIAQAKTDLIGGAPEELDTLKELADKIAAGGVLLLNLQNLVIVSQPLKQKIW